MSVSWRLSSNGDFQKQLAFGQLAETLIARWLLANGYAIMPIYDVEYETGKGPRLFSTEGQLAAPDLQVWRAGQCTFIEAKHKTVFTWYRKKQRWETGIDAHHWSQYQRVSETINVPVWLLFLHQQSNPHPRDVKYGCPSHCPTGLFGARIDHLLPLSRTDSRWGRHGMVYWGECDFTYKVPLEIILSASDAGP